MSIGLEIKVIRDTASPAIQEKIAKLSPQRLAAAAGPAAARKIRQHLVALGPNKRGWPSTHFYADAARSTSWAQTPEGALVSINKIGIRQRYFGGTIRPVKARMLTIPISPVSYGHKASEFPGAFVLRTQRGAYLVQKAGGPQGTKETKATKVKRLRGLGGNAGRRIEAGLNFLYKLLASVEQAADPGVLPSKEEMAATVRGAILEAMR